jgi:hypothetical protein
MVDSRYNTTSRPFFFGAKLIAIKKKDGGTRPIAIGDTFPNRKSHQLSRVHTPFPKMWVRKLNEIETHHAER